MSQAFAGLLKARAAECKLVLSQQHPFTTAAGKTLRPDGALLDRVRLVHGWWEAKDSQDDLDREIAAKRAKGYPTIVIAKRRKLPSPASGRGVGGEGASLPSPASGRGVGGEGETIQVMNWTQQHPVEAFPTVFAAESFPVPQAELKKEGWQLEPPVKRRLLERIRAAGKPLGEYVQGRFYYGIKTGFNEAFVIDGATRARLITEDPKSAEIIKPFLRGRDVKRWRVEFSNQYLIKIESSENKQHPWSSKKGAEAEAVFANTHPVIHAHFQNYRQALIDRYDQGKFFWELRACAYWQEFEKSKIFVPAIEDGVNYAPDLKGYYGNDKTNIIVSNEWEYLLALLNSSVSWWLTKQTFSGKQGGFYEFKPMYVSRISIPSASKNQKTLIEAVVAAILAPTALTPNPSPACGRGE